MAESLNTFVKQHLSDPKKSLHTESAPYSINSNLALNTFLSPMSCGIIFPSLALPTVSFQLCPYVSTVVFWQELFRDV